MGNLTKILQAAQFVIALHGTSQEPWKTFLLFLKISARIQPNCGQRQKRTAPLILLLLLVLG
jgi:hypothetical protein